MKEEYKVDIEMAVKQYADMVYRLAILKTNNTEQADDVFQDVFLKLFRYQNRISCEEHLKAWLIKVTINQCKSSVLSIWNKRRVSLDCLEEQAVDTKSYDYSEVVEAVRELPSKYREVIHLFYYEEFSIKEISVVLRRKEATVKTQLARGRNLLRERLGGEW